MAKVKQPKEDTAENPGGPPPLNLGSLNNLGGVIRALGKVIRGMANDTIESQKGARICNGLGILRMAMETKTVEEIGERITQLEGEKSEGFENYSTDHSDRGRDYRRH
jgi:hypothetical protein